MAVRSLWQSSLQKEGEPDELEAMLIYSMGVSVDGFIADRSPKTSRCT